VNDNNGYYGHDDGTDDQCAGIGAASVTITIRNHSKVPAGVSVNVETPLAKSIAFRSGWSVYSGHWWLTDIGGLSGHPDWTAARCENQ
jgi:hypothetical protein